MKFIGSKNGEISVFTEEEPSVVDHHLKIETLYSAISPGTELSMSSKSKDEVLKLGYSAVGTVVECGNEVEGFEVGDVVAVYGAPYTGHREYLIVPKTLCAKVGDGVDHKDAALAGLGAIAIHALRQADLQFGETIVVVGLGIYGQLISQIGRAAGFRVLPLNRSRARAELLESVSGIKSYDDEHEMQMRLNEITHGKGADAVFLCAGGQAGDLTNKSLHWLKDRGTSVIVGDFAVDYQRQAMFTKEIVIKISRAGGPGRYDTSYEKMAVDYPYGYVRWTEGRNTEEFIRLLQDKLITVSDYYDQPFFVDECNKAYNSLNVRGSSFLTQVIYYKKEDQRQ